MKNDKEFYEQQLVIAEAMHSEAQVHKEMMEEKRRAFELREEGELSRSKTRSIQRQVQPKHEVVYQTKDLEDRI